MDCIKKQKGIINRKVWDVKQSQGVQPATMVTSNGNDSKENVGATKVNGQQEGMVKVSSKQKPSWSLMSITGLMY